MSTRIPLRRLLALVSVLVAVDTMLYAALAPLLPHFADELDLSKALAGVLVGAYALGALVGGLPGGFVAARLGPRPAVLGGLALFSLASLGFAWADSFGALAAARFVQGCGSALTWAGAFSWLIAAAPRERRGELVGTAMGAAVFGALLGPALGAAAAAVGRGTVFTLVAALGAALGVLALRLPSVQGEEPRLSSLLRALSHRRFVGGLALMALPSLLFGVVGVLAPLHLSAAGWGATAIGALWIASAALETAQAPLVGRLTDRRGRLLPVRVALAVGAGASLGLAFGGRPLVYAPVLLVATLAYGVLFTPGLALIADGAEEAGVAQGLAFGVMNAAWALGAVIGPAAAGAIADATGDVVPFVLCGAACLAALAVVTERAGGLVPEQEGPGPGRSAAG
jgi:MFS family permease